MKKMVVAFDVVGTLIDGFDFNKPRSHMIDLYRGFRKMNNVELIVWSSDITLAREVTSKYRLEPDHILDKASINKKIADIAFDDCPDSISAKADKVFRV